MAAAWASRRHDGLGDDGGVPGGVLRGVPKGVGVKLGLRGHELMDGWVECDIEYEEKRGTWEVVVLKGPARAIRNWHVAGMCWNVMA
eukprot:scaffold543399_cov24-Prasinocladus_malaysianus.AAC.1